MQFFYWNKNFEVGIPEIDDQHRKLVDLINGLTSSVVEGGMLLDQQVLFGQIMEYAAQHFQYEEQLIATSQISEEEKKLHYNVHQSFVEKVRKIVQRPDLLQAEVSEKVLDFLTTWLISHILGMDTVFSRSLQAGEIDLKPVPHKSDMSSVERILLDALTETERRFRMISDHAPVLIWVCDATGSRGFCNRAWFNFVGIKEELAVTIDWTAFIHPDDCEVYRSRISELLTTPQPAEIEYRLRNGSGAYHWFLERIQPRIDTNEMFLGLIASSTDITAIKKAEELLSQSNRELETEIARRTEELEQERALASKVQANLLPIDLHLPGFLTASLYRPSNQIGGDFFDVLKTKNNIHLLIGDISGHSTSSALIMAVCYGMFRSLSHNLESPVEIVTAANRMLCQMLNNSSMFLSLVYMTLNREKDMLYVVSAGHNPVYLLDNGKLEEIASTGPVLGWYPDDEWEMLVFPFQVGSRLFLYTDGLVEARNADGEEFGARLVEYLSRFDADPATMISALQAELLAFSNGKLKDDLTMFAIERLD